MSWNTTRRRKPFSIHEDNIDESLNDTSILKTHARSLSDKGGGGLGKDLKEIWSGLVEFFNEAITEAVDIITDPFEDSEDEDLLRKLVGVLYVLEFTSTIF